MIDAILFDLDGTLLDTEALALTSGLAAFEAVGHPVDLDFMHGLIGKAEPQAAALIAAHRPGIDRARLNGLWRDGFNRAMSAGAPLKPFVAELLPRLALPLAVVTSSGRIGAHDKIGRAGLAAHFAEIITLDDVTRPKPAPEPYLLAAERLGVAPSRCVVFEDSDIGAEAAHHAGCIVVQVPDIAPTDGRFAAHVARDLMDGARRVGLV